MQSASAKHCPRSRVVAQVARMYYYYCYYYFIINENFSWKRKSGVPRALNLWSSDERVILRAEGTCPLDFAGDWRSG